MKKRTLPKTKFLHFALPWLGAGLLLGLILPGLIFLLTGDLCVPLCILGGVVLLAFGVVFAIKLHQDFGKVPSFQKHLAQEIPFDREKQYAVMRCSICTGERVVGFRNREDHTLVEVMVIQSEKDLAHFRKVYGIEEIIKEY